jgi:glycosyltransferase involved in cell wall biosynthesis
VRILMLVPYPNIQGPLPKHVPLLVDSLRALGCDIETEYWSRHAEHESLREKVVGRAADLRRIYARLRRRRFDAMYITTAHDWAGLLRDIPLVLLTKRVCPHRVIKFHGSYSGHLSAPGHVPLKLASRVLVGACDVGLVLSQEEKNEWSAFYPAGRFELVANAFIPELLGTAPPAANKTGGGSSSAHAGYRTGVPTLLFVGRLTLEKGILDLVQAVAHVNTTLRCRLLVAGDGPSAALVARTASELGIAGSVELLGYLSGPDLAGCYWEADALVLPSYREGFPTVFLEAMTARLPIVTTRLRGAVDRLEEGENCLFVPPGRPDLLADALSRILTDDHLRASMAANNLAKVKEFAPDVVAPQYLAIFKSVIGDHGAGSSIAAEVTS